jgi:monoamine oxidase
MMIKGVKPIDVPMDFGMKDGLELDVAVIGGGAAGLYTGWRLATSTKKKTAIFELSDRVCGRLHSVILPGLEIAGELGGMRFMEQHEIVTAVIEHVFKKELTAVDFPMGSGDPKLDHTRFFYMRGQRFRADAWENAQAKGERFVTRYFIDDDDVGLANDQLFNKIIYDVLMGDPWFATSEYAKLVSFETPANYTFKITAEQWDDIKPKLTYHFPGPYHKMRVNDMGFWNLIKDQIGEEGYNYLADAGGYYSNTLNWNAAEAFPYMVGDFSNASSTYKTIEGGYDRMLLAIARAYLDKSGTKIWGKNRLVTFRKAKRGDPRKYVLTFHNDAKDATWTVHADSIVLAVPPRSLALIQQNQSDARFFFEPDGPNSRMQKLIAATIPEPSLKILLAFDYDWWTPDFGARAGESITDLPMRQCYYFGTDPHDAHSLFLSSYNDMRTETFWASLERVKREHWQPRASRHASAAQLKEALDGITPDLLAPVLMVDEVMNEVRELHGLRSIPQPYFALYRNWTEDPFGGGYHGWGAGVDVSNVMKAMRKPYPDEDIHVVNEAWSDQQGWVEGAFCVAEHMLRDYFKAPVPGWFPKDYYLGW